LDYSLSVESILKEGMPPLGPKGITFFNENHLILTKMEADQNTMVEKQ
jgi:hypothetical protein